MQNATFVRILMFVRLRCAKAKQFSFYFVGPQSIKSRQPQNSASDKSRSKLTRRSPNDAYCPKWKLFSYIGFSNKNKKKKFMCCKTHSKAKSLFWYHKRFQTLLRPRRSVTSFSRFGRCGRLCSFSYLGGFWESTALFFVSYVLLLQQPLRSFEAVLEAVC